MLDLKKLREAVRHEGGMSRRLFLAYAAALASTPLLAERRAWASSPVARPTFSADPFSLGVASGDPEPTGVVLWTRLAPKPLQPDGGMTSEPVSVSWELAEDDAFRKIAASGQAVASPELAHAVHVEVDNLQPDRWYWYRFRAGEATSPVGRTRTAPAYNSAPGELRFAFASCQHYEAGLYTAYEQMARDELDLIVHLGDYIYEGAGRDKAVRKHVGPEIKTLADYRVRHAQYRSDAMLQAAHARCPWLVTWDDHEVVNNYASALPGLKRKSDGTAYREAVETFLERRAAAYQAYYEAMPLRKRSLPKGPDMTLYRTSAFGRLASFQVLDTRQYRSAQPNGDKRADINAATMAADQTLLGARQRQWLEGELVQSGATWNILAQQVMMGMVDRENGKEPGYSMDQWPGYARERMELVQYLQQRKVANPVVLTGDIHTNWVNDLRVDDRKPEQAIVATEFVGTSISSGGNGVDKPKQHDQLLAENPCVRYHNAERGYVRCKVTPQTWVSDYVVVSDVMKPGGTCSTRASFAVQAGKPGAVKA